MQRMSTTEQSINFTEIDNEISTKSNSIDYHKNVILLIGNPNVGKTSIFNQLSRKYAITANYPFTTVEVNTDAIRVYGKEFELIDAAGIYRLGMLSEQLHVPVIETIAIEGKGIDEIKRAIRKLKSSGQIVQYPRIVQQFYQEMMALFPQKNKPPRPIITLLALEDPFAIRWIEENYGREIAQKVNDRYDKFLDKNVVNLSIAILNSQNSWLQNIIEQVVTQKGEITKFGIQKFGQWSRHPVYGWIIVGGVIFLTYLIVGKFEYLFRPLIEHIDTLVPWAVVNRFLIGDYGLLTTGLFNAIGTVLPIITLFFLVLNFLEDIGYLTNLIILTNRLFKKVGLTGKSILPIVLGFGCKTMATLSTKILDSNKEKYIAIFLIGLAIPCSSQMSVIIAVLALQPISAFLIVISMLFMIEIIAGLVLNRIIPEEKYSDFIIEIPPIRLPDVKLLLQKTYYRTMWFLKEAVPLFIFGALLLFILHETGGMMYLEWVLRPIVVSFLNLPIHFSEALVMSLARSEAGAVLIMNMVKQGDLNTIQVIVAIIVITLFIPCISNVMAMIKELNLKKAMAMMAVITITAFLIGGLINYILRL